MAGNAREIYEARKRQAGVNPCEHIAARLNQGSSSGGLSSAMGKRDSGSHPFEHHGVLDVWRGRVIHFCDDSQVTEISLDEFKRSWPKIRTVRIPDSVEHGNKILEWAYGRVGPSRGDYQLLTNNCEHFATEAFSRVPHSEQVQEAGIATGAAAGLAVGGAVTGGVLSGIATTTTTTYALWVIPTGTAVSAAFPPAAVAGIAIAAAAGGALAVAGPYYAAKQYVQSCRSRVADYLPIGVVNRSGEDIQVRLTNVDAWSLFRSPRLDDFFGIGRMCLELARGQAGELNPAAEEHFHRFVLHVRRPGSDDLRLEVTRGEVIVYQEGRLSRVEPVVSL